MSSPVFTAKEPLSRPVDVTPAEVDDVLKVVNNWLQLVEEVKNAASGANYEIAVRALSQVGGIGDALPRVKAQKFGYDTHVAKVTDADGVVLILAHYQIPVNGIKDRTPKKDETAKLAGIVKRPGLGSVPGPVMLSVHQLVAAQATNHTVKLDADYVELVGYYKRFGYQVVKPEENQAKPEMAATAEQMAASPAAGVTAKT